MVFYFDRLVYIIVFSDEKEVPDKIQLAKIIRFVGVLNK